MKKILFMKAVTIEGNKHSFPLLKAEKFGRHNVDTGHEVTFKAGEFWGKGKVVTHGKDGCTVADETGREHSVHWNEVSKNHSEKLAKAHVKGFTRKNGSVVKEHDDSQAGLGKHSAEYKAHINGK